MNSSRCPGLLRFGGAAARIRMWLLLLPIVTACHGAWAEPPPCVAAVGSDYIEVNCRPLKPEAMPRSRLLSLNDAHDAHIQVARGWTDLEGLRIRSGHITNTGLKSLETLPWLAELSLDGVGGLVLDADSPVPELSELRRLDIRGTPFSMEGLFRLVLACPKLEHLAVDVPRLADKVERVTREFPESLRSLEICDSMAWNCPEVRFPSRLMRLVVRRVIKVGSELVELLLRMPSTTMVSLEFFAGRDSDTLGLINIPMPQQVVSIAASNRALSAEDMSALQAMFALTTLKLPDCRGVTDALLAHTPFAPSLQTLDLSSSIAELPGVSDAGVGFLRSAGRLRDLNLEGNRRVTVKSLAILSELPSLRVLIVRGCSFHGRLPSGKTAAWRLAVLCVDYTNISDGTLTFCLACQTVVYLSIAGNANLSALGISRAFASLPICATLLASCCPQLDGRALRSIPSTQRLRLVDLSHCLALRDTDMAQMLFRLRGIKEARLVGCNVGSATRTTARNVER